MNISALVSQAFLLAANRYSGINNEWISISSRLGALLPNSLLMVSIQRVGHLDILVRAMEDERPSESSNDLMTSLSLNYQVMLSEIWIGANYEVLRTLAERKMVVETEAFISLNHDLRLLRIPLEKYQLAAERKLSDLLAMRKESWDPRESDTYWYSPKDPLRAHIMPSSVAVSGSIMWLATDVELKGSKWLERRAISDATLALLSGDVEVKPQANE